MADIIKMTVSDLDVRPEEKNLLMTNPVAMSLQDKISLCEVAFESSEFPGEYGISTSSLKC